jgi:Antirestriction protein (ArdA)
MAREITNCDDIIDSRDVITRVEELEALEADVEAGGLDQSEAHELAALRVLADEANGHVADWAYGATLIRDSHFETYAEELAEDIGAINSSASWPNNCIDWEQAARQLQVDYTSVDFDGVTYWVR